MGALAAAQGLHSILPLRPRDCVRFEAREVDLELLVINKLKRHSPAKRQSHSIKRHQVGVLLVRSTIDSPVGV